MAPVPANGTGGDGCFEPLSTSLLLESLSPRSGFSTIVQPDTLLMSHHRGSRYLWRCQSPDSGEKYLTNQLIIVLNSRQVWKVAGLSGEKKELPNHVSPGPNNH